MQNPKLLKLFAESKLETNTTSYSFISIPVKHWDELIKLIPEREFFSVTKDREAEISLILETDTWESLDKGSLTATSTPGWRLFSLFGEGLMETAGYLAKICLLLAQNNISIMAFSTCQKSHLFVKEEDYAKAQAILKIFLSQSLM